MNEALFLIEQAFGFRNSNENFVKADRTSYLCKRGKAIAVLGIAATLTQLFLCMFEPATPIWQPKDHNSVSSVTLRCINTTEPIKFREI